MSSPLPPEEACGPRAPCPTYFTSRGRDLRLDILRGFCVLAMIVDHVAGLSPFYLLTGGNHFMTSAAEGFILISGITAGLIYRPLIERTGFAAATRKALRRAFSLYMLAVGLTFVIAPILKYGDLTGSQALNLSRPLHFVVSVFAIHQTCTLADVMLLYALLLAVMPLALLLLKRGHTRILLAASGLLWLANQLYPRLAAVPWAITGNRTFTFAAWQVIFFGALALGYHKDRLPGVAARSQRTLHCLSGLATAAMLAFVGLINLSSNALPVQLRQLAPVTVAQQGWIALHLYSKTNMGPLRIIATAIVFIFLFLSLTRWWEKLPRPGKAFLLPLGQNALYAYALHTILVAATWLGMAQFRLPKNNLWLNAVIQAAAVGAIWVLTRRQFLAPTARTRPYWYTAPLVLAGLFLVLVS